LAKALPIYEEIGNRRGIERVFTDMAQCYHSQGDYPRALDYQFKAMRIAEDIKDKEGYAQILCSIGNIYNDGFKNNTKCLEYYLKALKLDEETGQLEAMAGNYNNIGLVYTEKLHDYRKGLEYFKKGIHIAIDLRASYLVSMLFQGLAESYQGEGQNRLAMECYLRSLKIAKEIADQSLLSGNLEHLGELYLKLVDDTVFNSTGQIAKKGESIDDLKGLEMVDFGVTSESLFIALPTNRSQLINLALHSLQSALEISRQIGEPQRMRDCFGGLRKAYLIQGDYKRALESADSARIIEDSIFSNDNHLKIANLSTQREAELKENQQKINKIQAENANRNKLLYLTGIGLLAIVIVLVIRGFWAQRKGNRVKQELLLQKDMLMREIHHRVKNNLQVITALLDLQSGNLTDEKSKAALTESTTRVRAISLIHQHLYQDERITVLEISKFISDLFVQVRNMFHGSANKVALQNRVAEQLFDIDTILPLGLILNELFTNSFKYSFQDLELGEIEINLSIQGEHSFKLEYSDNGPGLPADYDMARSKSLGMRMMKRLSKQLGGGLEYDRNSRKFAIKFFDEVGRKGKD
jgi:two-component sensor histidine kinase